MTMLKLRYLRTGLIFVFLFLSVKIILTETGVYEIPTLFSLGLVLSILGISTIASLIFREKPKNLKKIRKRG